MKCPNAVALMIAKPMCIKGSDQAKIHMELKPGSLPSTATLHLYRSAIWQISKLISRLGEACHEG